MDLVEATLLVASEHCANGHQTDWRVIELLRHIEERRGSPGLTLTEAGRKLRSSPQYLGRIFRLQVGRGFKEQLRITRLRRAPGFLKDQRFSIKQIAAGLGYKHQTHFTSEFRKALGIGPLEHRRGLTEWK